MIKLGVIVPDPNDATSFYRGIGPISGLRGVEVHQLTAVALQWSDIAHLDCIFMQRPTSPTHLHIAMMCELMGKKLWIDYDDDVLNVDFANPTHTYYSSDDTRSRIKSILNHAHAITCSTWALKTSLETETSADKITIIPNALMTNIHGEVIKRRPLRRNRLINWRGTEHHHEYLIEFKEELIKLQKNNEGFCFNFFHTNPHYVIQNMDYTRAVYLPGVPLHEYPYRMFNLAPWVQIVPMTTTNFTASKSNIAWIEAIMYGGSVVVAPLLPEWKDLPGCYTYKDKKDFLRVTQTVLDMSESEIRAENRRARDFIKDTLDIKKVNEQRAELLLKLTSNGK